MKCFKYNVNILNNIIFKRMPRSWPSSYNKTSINQQNSQFYQQYQYSYQDNTNYQSTQNQQSMRRSSEHELQQNQLILLQIHLQIGSLDQGVSFYYDRLSQLRFTIDKQFSVHILKESYEIYQKRLKKFQLQLFQVKNISKSIPKEDANNYQQIQFRCGLIQSKLTNLKQLEKEIRNKIKLLNQIKEAKTKGFRVRKGRSLSKLDIMQMKTPEKAEKKVQPRSSSENKLCKELLSEMEEKSIKEKQNCQKNSQQCVKNRTNI